MMRVLEWDDPRARYPNLWREGMPSHVLAFDTVASRLRLGDLIAVFHPPSQKHPERSERFLGISRVVGLRKSEDPKLDWIDLETEHRFDPPLDAGEAPRRVFLCCDPGWPGGEVALFRKVAEAAVAAGWTPPPERVEEQRPPRAPKPPRPEPEAEAAMEPAPPPAASEPPAPEAPTAETAEEHPAPETSARTFAGAGYSGDMRDPREGTWLAIVETNGARLRIVGLEATGRHGLQQRLRDSDSTLLRAEAIGLGFPFGAPTSFAEKLGAKTAEGWWGFARHLERMSRPDYLVAVQEFRESAGEVKRWTDEVTGSASPLHRVNPDLAPMSYHGVRMVAEERSRYAIRPFENAKGRLLLEVCPSVIATKVMRDDAHPRGPRLEALMHALERRPVWPVEFSDPFRARCLVRKDALDAVMAARAAAIAVLSGETDRVPEGLPEEHRDRVHFEGWIYGLEA
jgi:hypothetical protein